MTKPVNPRMVIDGIASTIYCMYRGYPLTSRREVWAQQDADIKFFWLSVAEKTMEAVREYEPFAMCHVLDTPAYWQGNDDGVAGVRGLWERAINCTAPSEGTVGDPELAKLVRDTEALVLKQKTLDTSQ